MGYLTNNPATLRQLGALVCVEALVCIAAFVLGGTSAGVAGGVSAFVAVVLFCVFSFSRQRETMRLVAEIDEVLHAGRRFEFSDCREGDMSVLRNEVAKMTARLRRTADLLEREKIALADALADISHQIRTPLTAIELMVPVIERTRDGEERTRKLHDLERMVDRVSWLVTSLLKMARFDADAMALQKRPVDALAVVNAAIEPLAIALDIRGVDCLVEGEGSPTFDGDQTWTAEAVENIVKNCMEHVSSGGSVAIRVEEDAVATRIRISDTGPGIAAEDLPHIFERFYRGTTGGSPGAGPRYADEGSANESEMRVGRQPQGFGIGLSLAQSYVSAQGGTLRASNLAKGGACFEIAFPKMTIL